MDGPRSWIAPEGKMLSMRRLISSWPAGDSGAVFVADDMDQLNAFRRGGANHHIGRLLLAIDFAAIGTVGQFARFSA